IIVNNVAPQITGISNTGVTPDGLATILITFTDAGREVFTVTANWSDGTTATRVVGPANAGAVTFTHLYVGNPNPSSPAAPIPITVTVADDDGGEAFETTVADIQGPGLFTPTINVDVDIPTLTVAQAAPVTPPIVQTVTTFVTQSADVDSQSGEVAAVGEARAVLRVVFPTGEESRDFDFDPDLLDDLTALFERLPDNRYRVYRINIDGTEQRVSDVTVRGGKPDPTAEAGGAEGAGPELPMMDLSPEEIAERLRQFEELWEELFGSEPPNAQPPQPPTGPGGEMGGDGPPSAQDVDAGTEAAAEPADGDVSTPVRHSRVTASGMFALSAGAATAAIQRRRWSERVDEALSRPRRALSRKR
ncbi:MAG: hypothetical protein ACREJB_09240, partial [Planctomycetaceae bacterium]